MLDPGIILQRTFDSFTAKMTAREDFVLPARQIIAVGEVPYDTEQFAVSTLSGPYQGSPGSPDQRYSIASGGIVMLFQQFAISVVRKWPISDRGGRPPSAAAYSDASLTTAHDALVLQQTFEQSAADNSILGDCDTMYWSSIDFIGPSGATIGVRLTFVAQL